jgi:hypothetical protein
MYGVTKIGINATIQGKSIEERARVVSGNLKRIKAIMSKLDGRC